MPAPAARFIPRNVGQTDLVYGDLERQVPAGHLVRRVWSWLEQLNTREVEEQYSYLGRHGFHPRVLLAVWVYGSLEGMHQATRIHRALQTDAAYRWLTGGKVPSEDTLLRFVRDHGAFLEDVQRRLVATGAQLGLVHPDDLSGDSMRLRADASRASVRTQSRSEKRLEELSRVDLSALDEEARAVHEQKVAKHTDALAVMASEGTTSMSTTAEEAVLMKFPDGASMPGHRIQALSSGKSSRFVVEVLVSAEATDYAAALGLLERGRQMLEKVGVVTSQTLMKVALDAGYWTPETLQALKELEEAGVLDVLIASPRAGAHREAGAQESSKELFGRERFTVSPEGTVQCPAGTAMRGPTQSGEGVRREMRYTGVGCEKCPLRSQCTQGKARSVGFRPEADALASWMEAKLAEDKQGKRRYSARIATVEPVFAYLEERMGYRRATSWKIATVRNQVLLKVIAYNLSRLMSTRPLGLFFVPVSIDATGHVDSVWELPHDALDLILGTLWRLQPPPSARA